MAHYARRSPLLTAASPSLRRASTLQHVKARTRMDCTRLRHLYCHNRGLSESECYAEPNRDQSLSSPSRHQHAALLRPYVDAHGRSSGRSISMAKILVLAYAQGIPWTFSQATTSMLLGVLRKDSAQRWTSMTFSGVTLVDSERLSLAVPRKSLMYRARKLGWQDVKHWLDNEGQ